MRADALKTLWRDANALKRGLIVGLPIAAVAVVVAGAAFAISGSGPSSAKEAVVAPTAAPTDTAIPAPSATPAPTETPASAGLQASTAPPPSNGAGGGGVPVHRADPPAANLSGPGPAEGTGMSMVIPAIGVNASVYSRSIGENGQMGNPSGAYDVIWYDFSGWDGLGGAPGEPGANAVFAGHVDYIHIGPAVFWSIRDLAPGDRVTINTPSGPITYAIQWSQWAEPDTDFTSFVARTGQDSITLVTCIGGFSAGHYSNRLVVRGQRI
jgi:LPXTG-site transpeptidase (sortase) family protein